MVWGRRSVFWLFLRTPLSDLYLRIVVAAPYKGKDDARITGILPEYYVTLSFRFETRILWFNCPVFVEILFFLLASWWIFCRIQIIRLKISTDGNTNWTLFIFYFMIKKIPGKIRSHIFIGRTVVNYYAKNMRYLSISFFRGADWVGSRFLQWIRISTSKFAFPIRFFL